jgi:hypothetical protein
MINFVEESTVSDVNTEATTAEKDSMSPVEAISAATETTDAVGENSTVAERPEAEETQSPPETEDFGTSTENIFLTSIQRMTALILLRRSMETLTEMFFLTNSPLKLILLPRSLKKLIYQNPIRR